MAKESRRNQLIRDGCAKAIAAAGRPLHNTDLVQTVLVPLSLDGVVTAKALNTCLHDDPQFRFKRVAPGTWSLNPPLR